MKSSCDRHSDVPLLIRLQLDNLYEIRIGTMDLPISIHFVGRYGGGALLSWPAGPLEQASRTSCLTLGQEPLAKQRKGFSRGFCLSCGTAPREVPAIIFLSRDGLLLAQPSAMTQIATGCEHHVPAPMLS